MSNFKLEDFLYNNNVLQPLKGFCNTIQEGSINKAAKKMGLTQSTVTRQIIAIERKLDIKLFDRSGHSVKPTKAGKKLYKIAIKQIHGIESIFQNFHNEMRKDYDNTLTIAIHQAVGAYIIPKYIKQLLDVKEFKDIKIKLCNIKREDAFKRLINKEVDFAFYPSVKNESIPIEIIKKEIFKYKNTIIFNKNHPLAKKDKITKKDIQKYKYILRDQYTFYNIQKSLGLNVSQICFENGTKEMSVGLIVENIDISGVQEILLNNKSFKINENIEYRNTDHLFPESSYSLFYLNNFKPKKSVNFIIKNIMKDKDDKYK